MINAARAIHGDLRQSGRFSRHPASLHGRAESRTWKACKEVVENALRKNQEGRYNFYLVCGVQGAGKTHWVTTNRTRFSEPAIVFDAAHARACDRAGAVAQARRFSCHLTCIWISCPPDVALARNHARPADQVVPDEVVRLVFNNFEPPNKEEGFDDVLEIMNG